MGTCCSTVKTRREKEEKDIEEGDDNEIVEVKQIPHVFEEIVDAKHLKYMSKYSIESKEALEEFWGIGIENESYLQASIRKDLTAFQGLCYKRERYSVDYYKSFEPRALEACLARLRTLPDMSYPVWMNAHTFQKTDTQLRHRTQYDAKGSENPEFTESIHDILLREVPLYKEMYDESVVFDGDTIEFITQGFYRATVRDSVEELSRLKGRWLEAVRPRLNEWTGYHWEFPKRNEGLVTFLTTFQKNLSLCNTQTLHLNLTLPSFLRDGVLANKDEFMREHLNWVSWIQVLEPLIVAVYGTPDLFSLVSEAGYSLGSLRATRSRYISLQTYDVSAPMNGKLLLQPRPENPLHWYNRLMSDSPYKCHTEIGYDVNVNKFKNHGIEIRFLDWFPEEYLPVVMDLMVLLGAHARTKGCASSYQKEAYHGIIVKCLRQGSTARFTREERERVWNDMGFGERGMKVESEGISPYDLLCEIARELYHLYNESDVVKKMSPGMPLPVLVNYNELVLQEMWKGLYGTPTLILRSEASLFEQRTPLVPSDMALLRGAFRLLVESSPQRCFPDSAYRSIGAEIIPSGSWTQYPHALIIGLKGLVRGEKPLDTQTLFHFAHCFKKQEGWKETLASLGTSPFVDYEFMLDDAGVRTLSFCRQAGHVGAFYTLMAYYGILSCVSSGFSEEMASSLLQEVIPYRIPPRILLSGFGTVGKSAKAVFDRLGLTCDVKRSVDHITAKEILSYDIYVHAIRLSASEPIQSFLTDADLNGPDGERRRLTVLADLSCDLGHPWNPLPVYKKYGTREEPLQRIRDASFYVPASGEILYAPPLDLLAVPYLPSFDPVRSSIEFSSEFVWYLSEWKWTRIHPQRNATTRALSRALHATEEARLELCGARGPKEGGLANIVVR